MKIEVFGDGITKEDIKNQPHRIGCRGIVRHNDLYLMVTLKEYDITTFPGGGLEACESLEECVVREVLEETGVYCKVAKKTCEVTEYFLDSVWTNHYFLCDFIKETNNTSFTQEEIDLKLEKRWLSLDKILDIFENNMTKHENGPAIHNREFLGLINSI